MLHEVATIGVVMAVFVTIVWALIVMIAELKAIPAAKGNPVSGGE